MLADEIICMCVIKTDVTRFIKGFESTMLLYWNDH